MGCPLNSNTCKWFNNPLMLGDTAYWWRILREWGYSIRDLQGNQVVNRENIHIYIYIIYIYICGVHIYIYILYIYVYILCTYIYVIYIYIHNMQIHIYICTICKYIYIYTTEVALPGQKFI
jgi:hypothetical protein